MGCSDKKVYRINETTAVKIPKKKAAKPVADFHCNVCGHTKNGKGKAAHNCPGPAPITYQLTRQKICERCEWNADGICKALQATHPDRPCKCDVGWSNPAWKCPQNKWQRCLWKCDKCGCVSFDDRGLTKCPRCFRRPQAQQRITPRAIEPVRIRPTSKLAIVTVCVGTVTGEIGRHTIPLMQDYARRCGADFHAIYDDQWPEYRLGNKFRVGAYTPLYQRLLYIDADVFIRPTAKNLFELLPQGRVYMHEDGPHLRAREWLAIDEQKLKEEQGIERAIKCYNSGVVLWDRRHTDLWKPPQNSFTPTHTMEQCVIECNAAKYGIGELPTYFNTQWWMSDYKEREPLADFVHLANCPHRQRLAILQRLKATSSPRHTFDIDRARIHSKT